MYALRIAVYLFPFAAGPVGAGTDALCDWLETGVGNLPAQLRPADCETGETALCLWTFPFRDDNATEIRLALESAIAACPDATVRADAAVNHPDTFDAILVDIGDARWSLSLKDKAALGKTYVFLRRVAPDP